MMLDQNESLYISALRLIRCILGVSVEVLAKAQKCITSLTEQDIYAAYLSVLKIRNSKSNGGNDG